MYKGSKIRELLAIHSKKNKELLEYLGSSSNSTIAQLINGNPTVSKLEQVADFFGVSMDIFFERAEYQNNKNNIEIQIELLRQENAFLKEQIKQLEKQVKLLEKYNEELTRSKEE